MFFLVRFLHHAVSNHLRVHGELAAFRYKRPHEVHESTRGGGRNEWMIDDICWNYSPTSNSDHQDSSIFSRESL